MAKYELTANEKILLEVYNFMRAYNKKGPLLQRCIEDNIQMEHDSLVRNLKMIKFLKDSSDVRYFIEMCKSWMSPADLQAGSFYNTIKKWRSVDGSLVRYEIDRGVDIYNQKMLAPIVVVVKNDSIVYYMEDPDAPDKVPNFVSRLCNGPVLNFMSEVSAGRWAHAPVNISYFKDKILSNDFMRNFLRLIVLANATCYKPDCQQFGEPNMAISYNHDTDSFKLRCGNFCCDRKFDFNCITRLESMIACSALHSTLCKNLPPETLSKVKELLPMAVNSLKDNSIGSQINSYTRGYKVSDGTILTLCLDRPTAAITAAVFDLNRLRVVNATILTENSEYVMACPTSQLTLYLNTLANCSDGTSYALSPEEIEKCKNLPNEVFDVTEGVGLVNVAASIGFDIKKREPIDETAKC